MRILILAALAILPVASLAQALAQKGDWPNYGRDPGGARYSPLDQINTSNAARLERAWTCRTGERGRSLEATPIRVNGLLYFSTQSQKIVALDPETGKETWKFDPKSNGRAFCSAPAMGG